MQTLTHRHTHTDHLACSNAFCWAGEERCVGEPCWWGKPVCLWGMERLGVLSADNGGCVCVWCWAVWVLSAWLQSGPADLWCVKDTETNRKRLPTIKRGQAVGVSQLCSHRQRLTHLHIGLPAQTQHTHTLYMNSQTITEHHWGSLCCALLDCAVCYGVFLPI